MDKITTVTPTTSAVMRQVWSTVQLLTGDNGLDATDHLSRAEVLEEAVKLLSAARDREATQAAAAGWSYGDIGRALGITRTAAHMRYSTAVAQLREEANA